jgi:hypothetical protein
VGEHVRRLELLESAGARCHWFILRMLLKCWDGIDTLNETTHSYSKATKLIQSKNLEHSF